MAHPIIDFVVVSRDKTYVSFLGRGSPKGSSLLPSSIRIFVEEEIRVMASQFARNGEYSESLTREVSGEVFEILLVCWKDNTTRDQFFQPKLDLFQRLTQSLLVKSLAAASPNPNIRMRLQLDDVLWLNSEILSASLAEGGTFQEHLRRLTGRQ